MRVSHPRSASCRDGNDPIIVDALVSGLRGVESKVLQQIIQPANAQGPEDAVTVLSAALAKSGDVALVQVALDAATDTQRPAWQRRALLAGLSAALPAPQTAGRGGQVRTPGLSAPGRDRAQITPGAGVTLAAEPVALTNLAAGAGPDAAFAADVVARFNWIGKAIPNAPARRIADRRRAEALRIRTTVSTRRLRRLPRSRREGKGQLSQHWPARDG